MSYKPDDLISKTSEELATNLIELVRQQATLKYPSAESYAYEAGMLSSIIKTLAINCPELKTHLGQEIEWYKNQVKCLSKFRASGPAE